VSVLEYDDAAHANSSFAAQLEHRKRRTLRIRKQRRPSNRAVGRVGYGLSSVPFGPLYGHWRRRHANGDTRGVWMGTATRAETSNASVFGNVGRLIAGGSFTAVIRRCGCGPGFARRFSTAKERSKHRSVKPAAYAAGQRYPADRRMAWTVNPSFPTEGPANPEPFEGEGSRPPMLRACEA
jgi:hypothetical protein